MTGAARQVSAPVEGWGLDFGTTRSVVARFDPRSGKVRSLRGEDGQPHPSVVWYRPDGHVQVGLQARRHVNEYAGVAGHRFERSIKRKLGTPGTVDIFGERVPHHRVASDILRFLREHAEAQEKRSPKSVVFTIPVGFDGRQRKELRKAADLAGIDVSSFIHEPFAAFVAHSLAKDGPDGLESWDRGAKHVLVFDWGGGTLDITVCRIEGGVIREVGTSDMPDCAGDDFDERLVSFTRARFLDRHQLSPNQCDITGGTRDRYLFECEKAKIALSGEENAKVRVPRACTVGDRDLDVDEGVGRGDFEALINGHVSEAMSKVTLALDAAGLADSDLDRVLVIGGTSLIPMVRRRLLDRFSARVVVVENADTIIAEGAAWTSGLMLRPVLTNPIGVVLSDGTFETVFGRDCLLDDSNGTKRDLMMFCTDNRGGLAHLVLAEERGSKVIRKQVLDIPVAPRLPKPHNHERVTVNFDINRDFVLRVSGRGATRGKGSSMEIHDLCFGLKVV